MFIYCCGECYEYKGLPIVCPKCGKRLRLPRRAETLGVLERKEDEEDLIECPPPTPLKNNRENNS